jgi:Trm5-related predicted tRNA methylase
MVIQLDFFTEMTETEELREEIRQLRASHEKIRKSLYARHGELAKKYCEIHERLQVLEHNICRNNFNTNFT